MPFSTTPSPDKTALCHALLRHRKTLQYNAFAEQSLLNYAMPSQHVAPPNYAIAERYYNMHCHSDTLRHATSPLRNHTTPCLAVASLNISTLRFAIAESCHTMHCHSYATLWLAVAYSTQHHHALPLPHISLHCHCKTVQITAIHYHSNSSLHLAIATHCYTRPNLAIAM